MSRLRRCVLVVLAAIAAVAALVAGYSMRRSLIDDAQSDLQTRGFHKVEVVGVRVPCYGLFDVGVAVVFRTREGGEATAGRLCRSPVGSGEWSWYPNYGGPDGT